MYSNAFDLAKPKLVSVQFRRFYALYYVKPIPVFETILGHSFAAEALSRPLVYLCVKVENSQEKCLYPSIYIQSSTVFQIYRLE